MVYFIVFVVFLLFMLLMSIGVIFGRKPISGSCGGLGAVGIEKSCDCDKPCAKKQKELLLKKDK